jgi:hypothetical protein
MTLVYNDPWKREPKYLKNWPKPHSCKWCSDWVLDFRGSREDGQPDIREHTQYSSELYSSWLIAMYRSISIPCGDALTQGLSKSCELATYVLDDLEISSLAPPDLRNQDIILNTSDGLLRFSCSKSGKTTILSVDILSEDIYVPLKLTPLCRSIYPFKP